MLHRMFSRGILLLWCFNSPASRLFVPKLVQAHYYSSVSLVLCVGSLPVTDVFPHNGIIMSIKVMKSSSFHQAAWRLITSSAKCKFRIYLTWQSRVSFYRGVILEYYTLYHSMAVIHFAEFWNDRSTEKMLCATRDLTRYKFRVHFGCVCHIFVLHSSSKVMAVFVQYQNLCDNLFRLLWVLVCVYLGSLSVLLVNFVVIGRIFIACDTSKLGTKGMWEIKFQTNQFHGSI